MTAQTTHNSSLQHSSHARQMPQELAEAQLVAAIASGCPRAESELIRRYRRRLVRRLTPETRDWARAEDLAHEALLIVLLRLRGEGIREPAKLGAYVLRTGYLVFLSWIRKKSNQYEMRETFDDQMADAPLAEEVLVAEQEGVRLRSAIAGLPVQRDRDILNRYLADQPKEVVCEELGLSCAHYDRVISRARARVAALDWDALSLAEAA